MQFYGKIALEGSESTFEQFSAPLQRWYQVQAHSPEKDCFSTVFIDIADEKKSELEDFFNVNLDLLFIADLDGNFLKVNKEWENVLGYKESEIENAY
ncbi:MAG TPA: PAS domain S-box protein [Candidatus Marinimicrobia bacterium]|nr:PAS domain S-box protein [Candidatus Neomarinimicrobiota bacterium]